MKTELSAKWYEVCRRNERGEWDDMRSHEYETLNELDMDRLKQDARFYGDLRIRECFTFRREIGPLVTKGSKLSKRELVRASKVRLELPKHT